MKVILLIMIGLSLLQADYIRDDTNEVVLDTTTNLIWQDDLDAKTIKKTWIDAIEYCEALTLGGFLDWRLPNFNELYLLTDKSIYNLAINPIFTNVGNSYYWSSTASATDTTKAWGISFLNSNGFVYNKIFTDYVRCVR